MHCRGRILIVDDDPVCRSLFSEQLDLAGFTVSCVDDSTSMNAQLEMYSFDIILLDIELDNENGIQLIPDVINRYPYTKIIVLTGHASIGSAISAIRSGADDYVEKDCSEGVLISKLSQLLQVNPSKTYDRLSPETLTAAGLIGESEAFSECCEQLLQLSQVDSTILILGESGTGKEVVARMLHNLSNRGVQRFSAINCAAVPETLLESELFGHRKGAFTDAKNNRAGIFEVCSEGTLLLDEIGDMPISLQAKLLRVLQEQQITPLGTSQPVKVNTRIIAATHRDLKEEIQNGHFREDLFYRLSVVPIWIPPLRHRKSDVPLLFRHFIAQFNQKFNRKVQCPGHEFFKRLQVYDWPGNVRELRNAVERAVVLSRDDTINANDLFRHLSLGQSGTTPAANANIDWIPHQILGLPLTEAKQAFERQYVTDLLKQTKGNISQASKQTGRYRADIYRLLEKYNIDHGSFRHLAGS